LIRVFGNLVGNAIKFSSRGSRITIGAEAVANEIRFSIRDWGRGIASSDLPVLFEPYRKGKDAGKSGSGLGLFICKRIVEAHGGRIWVESEPDVGSIFVFTVPLSGSA
jgi:signal transduction histidine kinase